MSETTDQTTIYGYTLPEIREQIHAGVLHSDRRFDELIRLGRKMTPDETRDLRIAQQAVMNGWATLALLGRIADKYGPAEALAAASMVDDMGHNGGAPYCDDLPVVDQAAKASASRA